MLFHTDGSDAIHKALWNLNKVFVDKHLTRIMSGAGKTVVEAARANLKNDDTGTLRRSLGIAVRANPRKGRIRVVLGPRKGEAFRVVDSRTGTVYRDPVKYAHLIEFGSQPHAITRRGVDKRGRQWVQVIDHPGTEAQPFMRPAFDSTSPGLINDIGLKCGRMLEQEAVAMAAASASERKANA